MLADDVDQLGDSVQEIYNNPKLLIETSEGRTRG